MQQSTASLNTERIYFATESKNTYRNSQLFRHNPKKLYRTTRLRIINDIIYVDDTALVFPSRPVLKKALLIALAILSSLGLEMHIGKWPDTIHKKLANK